MLIYTKLQEKSSYCSLLIYSKKPSQQVKTHEILAAFAISYLHSGYNFAIVLKLCTSFA